MSERHQLTGLAVEPWQTGHIHPPAPFASGTGDDAFDDGVVELDDDRQPGADQQSVHRVKATAQGRNRDGAD